MTAGSNAVTATSNRDSSRVQRLVDASGKRERGIEDLLEGRLGDGSLIPRDLLSVHGLGLDLSPAQERTLGREESASILQLGVSFEAALCVGFAHQALTSPLAHQSTVEAEFAQVQIGEETRHTRVFIELLRQIDPMARSPFDRAMVRLFRGWFAVWMARRPLFFQILVLGGEEIPDLMQRLVSEHPQSDPHLAAVASYHRAEEARHMSFARLSIGPLARTTSAADRYAARHLAPLALQVLWDGLVHPGVYRAAGLDPWATWRAVRLDPARVALRHEATRTVLRTVLDSDLFGRRGVPRGWRRLCGVGRDGTPC